MSEYSLKQLDATARKAGYRNYTEYLRAMHQKRYRGKKMDWNKTPATKKKPSTNFIKDVYNNVPFHPIRYVSDKVKGIL
jgi:hypothetical protein